MHISAELKHVDDKLIALSSLKCRQFGGAMVMFAVCVQEAGEFELKVAELASCERARCVSKNARMFAQDRCGDLNPRSQRHNEWRTIPARSLKSRALHIDEFQRLLIHTHLSHFASMSC